MSLKYSLIVCLLINTACFSQQKITLSNIEKLILKDGMGGMEGSGYTTYEIKNDHGKWLCYKTDVGFFSPFERLGALSAENRKTEGEKSQLPKLIRHVDVTSIATLLNSIGHIKSYFDWKEFNLSAKNLVWRVDTFKYKNAGDFRKAKITAKYYTDDIIKRTIEESQQESITDVGFNCSVYIVKKDRDTVKVTTSQQPLGMLPWKINDVDSYDLHISAFFASVVDPTARYSNRANLLRSAMIDKIDEYISNNFSHKELELDDWNSSNPENLRFLNSNFNVTYNAYNSGGDECYLSNKLLPLNVCLKAVIDINDMASLARLVRHRDSIVNYVKRNNFVLDYYLNKPKVNIIFPWEFDFSTKSWFWEPDLQKKLPELKKYDLSQALYFITGERAHNQFYDGRWLILPDNKLLLLNYSVNGMASNIPVGLIKNSTVELTKNDSVYILFSENGDVLEVSK